MTRRTGARRLRASSALLIITTLAAAAVGCGAGKTGPTQRTQGGDVRRGQEAARVRHADGTGGGSIDDIFGPAGSSAERLHELSGPLLAHYAGARRLPETLEELQPVPGAGAQLDFRSPVSGKPLVYAPYAVPPPGEQRRLVLYDPTPTAKRTYWAILMGYPRGNQPAATWVVELPEQALRKFAAATTQPAGGAR